MLVIPVHNMPVLPDSVTYIHKDEFVKSTGRFPESDEKAILLITKNDIENDKLGGDDFRPLAVSGSVREGTINGYIAVKTSVTITSFCNPVVVVWSTSVVLLTIGQLASNADDKYSSIFLADGILTLLGCEVRIHLEELL